MMATRRFVIGAVLTTALAWCVAVPAATANPPQRKSVCTADPRGSDEAAAKAAYQSAVATKIPAERAKYLEASLAAKATYEAAYMLGETLSVMKDSRAARDCFTFALGQARTDTAKARAAANIGAAYG